MENTGPNTQWRFGIFQVIIWAASAFVGTFPTLLPIGMSNDSGAYPWAPILGISILVITFGTSLVMLIWSARTQSKERYVIATRLALAPILLLIGLVLISSTIDMLF